MEEIKFRTDPLFVDLTQKAQVPSTIDETMIQTTNDAKDDYLYYFLTRFKGRSIIFVNAISCLRRLFGVMQVLELPVMSLHAEMAQKQRLKSLERFKALPNAVLIATDVAARGLDIPMIDHVVHYQLPRTSEIYIHRVGRVGRANQKGFSLALVSPDDVNNYKKLCSILNKDSGIPAFHVENSWFLGCRERVKVAQKLESLAHANHSLSEDVSWFSKNAKEADMVWEEEGVNEGFEEKRKADQKKLKELKGTLKTLLSTSLLPKGTSKSYITGDDVSGLDVNTKLRVLDGQQTASLSVDVASSLSNHAKGKHVFVNQKLLGKRKTISKKSY